MAKYKVLLLLSLFTLNASLCFGQKRKFKKEKTSAIVQYNDGSVFIGQIIYEGALDLKMILTTKDTINLHKVHIKRIRRTDKNIALFNGAKFHYTKGLFYSLQLGGGGSDNANNVTNQTEVIIGYRFNKKVATGIGFGASYNSTISFGDWLEANSLPVFAYGRYYPFDKKVRPFIAGRLGWAFPNQDAFGGDHRGGVLIQPEIGVNFASRRRMRFLLSIGQQIQNIRGENLNFDPFFNPVTTKFNLWFNRTVFKIGFEWK